MPHQHSFCKGDQAMFESSNTIPCLRVQPTSMLFSMKADHRFRRELLEMVLSCSVVNYPPPKGGG